MSAAAASPLAATDRLWPAVVISVAAHVALFVVASAARPPVVESASQRPIQARLVRLGQERPKELLPRKEPEAPPAAQPEAPPAPPQATAAPPATPGKAGPTAPAKAAAPGATKAGPAAPGTRPSGSRLSSVLSQLSQEIREGSPDGDPLGEASQAEGDQYLAAVVQTLRRSYRLPATIPERERQALSGTLLLHVDREGKITSFEFTRKSGNPVFDEALERAVRQTRLPPPPAAQREIYQRGVEVDFRI